MKVAETRMGHGVGLALLAVCLDLLTPGTVLGSAVHTLTFLAGPR